MLYFGNMLIALLDSEIERFTKDVGQFFSEGSIIFTRQQMFVHIRTLINLIRTILWIFSHIICILCILVRLTSHKCVSIHS